MAVVDLMGLLFVSVRCEWPLDRYALAALLSLMLQQPALKMVQSMLLQFDCYPLQCSSWLRFLLLLLLASL